jgi:hypothetical protein
MNYEPAVVIFIRVKFIKTQIPPAKIVGAYTAANINPDHCRNYPRIAA